MCHKNVEAPKIVYSSSKNSHCKTNASSDCFKIIDSDKSFLKLKIKEGFHITREKTELNVQVKHFKTSFI